MNNKLLNELNEKVELVKDAIDILSEACENYGKCGNCPFFVSPYHNDLNHHYDENNDVYCYCMFRVGPYRWQYEIDKLREEYKTKNL